jgi:hypothetical protein
MQRPSPHWFLSAALVVSVLLVVALGQRKAGPAKPLDDYAFHELLAHLSGAGLELRAVSPQKNGLFGATVFLTTTDKGWNEVNRLTKDPRRIAEWQGVLYCECVKGRDSTLLTNQWGGDCLVVGSFVFYGDHELLNRVRAALSDFTPQ